jgi:hypothetical protein
MLIIENWNGDDWLVFLAAIGMPYSEGDNVRKYGTSAAKFTELVRALRKLTLRDESTVINYLYSAALDFTASHSDPKIEVAPFTDMPAPQGPMPSGTLNNENNLPFGTFMLEELHKMLDSMESINNSLEKHLSTCPSS